MIILRPLATRLFTAIPRGLAASSLAVMLTAFMGLSGLQLPIGPSLLIGQEPSTTDTAGQEPTEKPSAEADSVQAKPKDAEDSAEENTAEVKPEVKEPGPITALVNGRILTMSDAGEIDSGTILIQDGKIKSVGVGVEVPEGAKVIDVSGMIVTPGLVDLRSKLWLTSLAASDTGSTAALDVLDAIDSYATDWKEVARQGITAVYVQPSARGSLGGYGSLLRVAPGGDDLEKTLLVKHAGFQSSLGVGTSNSSTKSKVAEFNGLKKRFSDAKEYAEQWKKYREYEEAQAKKKKDEEKVGDEKESTEKARPEGQTGEASRASSGMRRGFGGPRPGFPGGRPVPPGTGGPSEGPVSGTGDKPGSGDKPEEKKDVPADKKQGDASKPSGEGESKEGESKSEEKPPKKPDQDPLKDRLVEILEGKVPMHLEVHGLDDAQRALEFAKEFEITVVLEGLSDLSSSKDVVVESSLPIVLGPWLDSELESYHAKDRITFWSDCFSEYEGRLVIASFARTARGSKQLRYHAAAAVAAGFEPKRVLESITTNAALLAGAGESHGKIKAGFAADMAVFAGHPLNPAAPVVMTLSAGDVTYQSSEMPTPIEMDELLTEVDFPESLAGEYAIKSQRMLMPNGSLAPGILHVVDGMIKGVLSADEEIAGVRIIDVGNAVVTPGLISAHTELALASLVDRQGLADSGPVRAADVYDALLPSVRRLVDGGFLRAISAPASDRVIAGQAAELRLLAKEPVINAELAEKVVLSNSARNRERFPSSLAGQQQLIRNTFSGQLEPSPLYLPAAALTVLDDARAERQKAILEGKRPVMMLVETDGEVDAAAKLIRETGVNGILVGADQWESLIGMITKIDDESSRPGCIVRPMNSGDYDWYTSDIAKLASTGAGVAFAGEDPLAIRKTVAAVVQAGMPADAALRALTIDAAKMLGMSSGAGQFIAGTAADFVVWNGSPLNLSAQPVAIVIDGTLVDEKSK